MIGRKLRAYEITEEIGAGGMATVYRAYQPSMDRHVAIKVIRSAILHDAELRERFQREARLIARLEHPHLLPVYDFDGEHDPPYIVMRYLEGGTLKQVKERDEIPRGELLYILRQIAGALDYAHRQGVVHRDLKPSNIMIDREGNAFLTDFGIARSADGQKELTGTGMLIGTPGYMAPEQARGEGPVDKSADIYSLGALVFELLTGTPPYQHENNLGLVLAHLNEPVPRATERNPELPKAVDDVLMRALAKQESLRQASAETFVQELASALKVKPSDSAERLQSVTQTLSLDQLAALQAQKKKGDTPSHATPTDQQRQMTTVYVDVTELAEIMYESGADAEKVRTGMDALWKQFSDVAKEQGGVIQSRADDMGILLWGRDRAREDDSERALRAALRMRERVETETRKLLGSDWEPDEKNPIPFSAGVCTGAVLLERESESGSYTASGATITLAGRLKDAAGPGHILAAHETYSLVRGVFTFHPRDPLRLRGRKEPLEVYDVVRVKPRAFRVKARGIEGVETRMIGREIELRLLQEALTLTLEDGETQVVTVVGEAGVGKSRLLYEFSEWTDLQEATVWFFQARATQPSMLQPYSLTRDLFSFRFQILDSDPLSVVHDKFVKGIAGFFGEGTEREARLIGQLVGFDFTEYPDVAVALKDSDTFRQEAQKLLGSFFTSASETNPVVIHIEDIHWADDRSLDVVNNLVRENTNIPLFILCMARPSLYERRPQWGEGQRFHERIQLEPLSQLSSRRLVKELLKKVDEVPAEMRDLIVDRADGNPFYIEEMIKALIDDRVIVKGDDEWTIDTSRLADMRIPATLTGVLQSRLDTLPVPLYQLLQRASVVGRIFWDSAAIELSKEAGVSADEVRDMLEELREREMLLRREESNFAGTVEYVFRHAILRDVTYDTVVPRQRRALHKQVADWLLDLGGERAAEHTLLVAEHYGRADEPSLAAQQLQEAGDRAMHLGAFSDAGTLLQRAHELLKGDDHRRQRVSLDLTRGHLEAQSNSYARAQSIVEGALADARALEDKGLMAKALGELARISMWQDDRDGTLAHLEEALPLAREVDDKESLVFMLRQMGNVNWDHPEVAIPYLTESIELAKQTGNRRGQAGGLNSLGNSLIITAADDDVEAIGASESAFNESLDIYREMGDRPGEAMVLGNRGELFLKARRYEDAERDALSSYKIITQIGDRYLRPSQEGVLAEICMLTGREDEARTWLRKSLESTKAVGASLSLLTYLFGVLKARTGDRETGLQWIGNSMGQTSYHTASLNESFGRYRDDICKGLTEDELQALLDKGKELEEAAIIARIEKEFA